MTSCLLGHPFTQQTHTTSSVLCALADSLLFRARSAADDFTARINTPALALILEQHQRYYPSQLPLQLINHDAFEKWAHLCTQAHIRHTLSDTLNKIACHYMLDNPAKFLGCFDDSLSALATFFQQAHSEQALLEALSNATGLIITVNFGDEALSHPQQHYGLEKGQGALHIKLSNQQGLYTLRFPDSHTRKANPVVANTIQDERTMSSVSKLVRQQHIQAEKIYFAYLHELQGLASELTTPLCLDIYLQFPDNSSYRNGLKEKLDRLWNSPMAMAIDDGDIHENSSQQALACQAAQDKTAFIHHHLAILATINPAAKLALDTRLAALCEQTTDRVGSIAASAA